MSHASALCRVVVVLLIAVLGQGCVNYLYTGRITALDSADAERDVVLYWQKTAYLGTAKAGPLMVLTACGRPLTFSEWGDPQRIVYRGMAGSDRMPDVEAPLVDGAICGEVVGERRFRTLRQGDVAIRVACEPVADDEGFSVVATYIAARREPYRFPVTVQKRFRWFGGGIEPPTVVCPN